MKKLIIIIGLIIVLCSLIFAQIKIPLEKQIPIILKALNYNKTIGERVKKNVNIAVIFNDANELSKLTKDKIKDILEDNNNIKIFKKKIKVIPIPYTTKEKLEKKVFIKKLNAFFLSSELETYMPEIIEVAKFNKIITISPDEGHIVNAQAALGVVQSGSVLKPYVNLVYTKNNNIELDFKLLKIAEVIK